MTGTLFDDFVAKVATKSSDEYYTPKWIFDAIGLDFDLDVCAPQEGPLHTPAAKWYSAADDGLVQPWFGRVWMNPPYSNPTPWIDRWLDHGNGMCLVPLTKSMWSKNLWAADTVVMQTPPQMRFVTGDGKEASIVWATFIWAIGEECKEALRNSGISKCR